MVAPERVGLIDALPGADEPLAEEGLYNFASVQAGEFDNQFASAVKCRRL